MTEDEIGDFVVKSRTAPWPPSAPTASRTDRHVVRGGRRGNLAGDQGQVTEAVNLFRDPRVTFLIEDGDTYDTLRGVSFEGVAEIVDDPDVSHRVGVSVWERYTGPTATT